MTEERIHGNTEKRHISATLQRFKFGAISGCRLLGRGLPATETKPQGRRENDENQRRHHQVDRIPADRVLNRTGRDRADRNRSPDEEVVQARDHAGGRDHSQPSLQESEGRH